MFSKTCLTRRTISWQDLSVLGSSTLFRLNSKRMLPYFSSEEMSWAKPEANRHFSGLTTSSRSNSAHPRTKRTTRNQSTLKDGEPKTMLHRWIMPIRSHKGDSRKLHIRIGTKKRRRIQKLCGLLNSKILADSRIHSIQEVEEAHTTTSREVQQHPSRDNNSNSRETSYQASLISDE